jgi:hypothetical protein
MISRFSYSIAFALFLLGRTLAPAAQQYSIGNPTNEEQAYVEMINRARANPVAEGVIMATATDANVLQAYVVFGVNLVLMQAQLAAIPPLPPLAMNPFLNNVARAHSADMLANNFQGHVGSDGRDITARILDSGYVTGPASFGESVFAHAISPFHGHASFEVDWGPGPGGMQTPPEHRNNNHSSTFREIGVGVSLGTNQSVGPQVVTEEFGVRDNAPPFIIGVVYQDSNGNGMYDAGEGIGGVRVDVAGADFFAVTASSGGYVVPVAGNGAFTVNFSGGSVSPSQQTATITNGNNVKVDYRAGVAASPVVLANISTRLRVETDDNVLIGGFIVTGTAPKRVVVRAIGPSLSVQGVPVPGRLENPTLELHGPSGMIASNDNWREAQSPQEIIDAQIAPTDDLESAILTTLPANGTGYTAIVRGASGGTGVGLVEVYDLDRAANSSLANISSRGFVQTGDDVMIGGFILTGTGTRKVIVRAIGPSLPVAGALADPTLELVNANGVTMASNDNWRSDQEAEIIASTVAPTNDLESAIVATLPPAAHTAILRGKNGMTGVALVEVFALP